ncbi:MAG: carbohydrate ABC transporter permease [bacterium]
MSSNARILASVLAVVGLGLLSSVVTVLRHKGRARGRAAAGYLFIGPSFLHLLLFFLGPMVFILYLAFHRWNIVDPVKPFVGLKNFYDLFHDDLFWGALKNTVVYTLHVPVAMVISLGVAVLLSQKVKGVTWWRTLFFLPAVSSYVAIAMVWQWIYHPHFGLINHLLGFLGLGPYPWLTSPATALLSIMIMAVWMQIGYQMVIFLAGLQSIPGHFYEAAVIDGASSWQRFRQITLPLLKPTTFFVLVTSIISSFQVFTSVFVMTEGGPSRSTDVAVYHIYQNGWEYLKMGYASAMALVLLVIIMVVTLIQFKLLGKRVEYA